MFGNLLEITNHAFLKNILFASIALILIIIIYRPFMISTFDLMFSRMFGLNTT
ncbi:metal ABC transporter permease [Staphylococcus aureus]